jgi:hypothetical protein
VRILLPRQAKLGEKEIKRAGIIPLEKVRDLLGTTTTTALMMMTLILVVLIKMMVLVDADVVC